VKKVIVYAVITISSLNAGWVSFDGTPVPTPPSLEIISGGKEGFTLKISVHGMYVEDTIVEGVNYQILSILSATKS